MADMEGNLKDYNLSQQEAILHGKGPCMVIAGPGSGKTAVIVERVRRLTKESRIPGSNILVVTYTRDAAEEMKKRYLELISSRKTDVTFGTFHSIFFHMVTDAKKLKKDCVADGREQADIIKSIIVKEKLPVDTEPEIIESIMSEISRIKTTDTAAKEYKPSGTDKESFRKIYNGYEEALGLREKIDFDDMLIKALELLRDDPDILAQYQEKYKYILIDEFQDINPLQYEIINLLSGEDGNIFCVGDDDQSIYGFRGAEPGLMKRFLREHPGCRKITLNKNYRCGRNIALLANKLMQKAPDRFSKESVSETGILGDVRIKKYLNRQEEYSAVVKNILDQKARGEELSDTAVLFRTNNGARGIVDMLYKYNVPFTIDKMPYDIFDSRAGRDILTFFEIAHGDDSRASYLRIINKPSRMIKRDSFRKEHVNRDELMESFSPISRQRVALEKLFRELDELKKMAPAEGILYIRREIGYDKYINDLTGEHDADKTSFTDALYDIYADALEFSTYKEWREHIEERRRALEARTDSKEEKGRVRLLTMHSAKGLEFNKVFIIDCNKGVVPHKKAVTEKEIAEERRMFFVAITRAKEALYIYCTKERYGRPAEYSEFLNELLS